MVSESARLFCRIRYWAGPPCSTRALEIDQPSPLGDACPLWRAPFAVSAARCDDRARPGHANRMARWLGGARELCQVRLKPICSGEERPVTRQNCVRDPCTPDRPSTTATTRSQNPARSRPWPMFDRRTPNVLSTPRKWFSRSISCLITCSRTRIGVRMRSDVSLHLWTRLTPTGSRRQRQTCPVRRVGPRQQRPASMKCAGRPSRPNPRFSQVDTWPLS